MKAHESYRHPAPVCRSNGWAAGDILVGRSPGATPALGVTAARLTAVGELMVLAVRLADCRGGRWHPRPDRREEVFALVGRDWRKATSKEAADVERAVNRKSLFGTEDTTR